MHKFNKRAGSAVKQRKIKLRVHKKRAGAAQEHKNLTVRVSGARTGKAKTKARRQQNRQARASAVAAAGEVEMRQAPGLKQPIQPKKQQPQEAAKAAQAEVAGEVLPQAEPMEL